MKNEELLTWINGMPEWVRKATILFYQKGVITDDDIKDLADVCLFGDNSFSVSGINLIDHGAIQGYSISSIDSVEGVNAISSDKPLEFKEKGITVVYGLNGAGKSGYTVFELPHFFIIFYLKRMFFKVSKPFNLNFDDLFFFFHHCLLSAK